MQRTAQAKALGRWGLVSLRPKRRGRGKTTLNLQTPPSAASKGAGAAYSRLSGSLPTGKGLPDELNWVLV